MTVELKEKQPTEGLEVGKGQQPSRWRYSYAALCILCIVRSRHSVRELRALSAEELTDTIHLLAQVLVALLQSVHLVEELGLARQILLLHPLQLLLLRHHFLVLALLLRLLVFVRIAKAGGPLLVLAGDAGDFPADVSHHPHDDRNVRVLREQVVVHLRRGSGHVQQVRAESPRSFNRIRLDARIALPSLVALLLQRARGAFHEADWLRGGVARGRAFAGLSIHLNKVLRRAGVVVLLVVGVVILVGVVVLVLIVGVVLVVVAGVILSVVLGISLGIVLGVLGIGVVIVFGVLVVRRIVVLAVVIRLVGVVRALLVGLVDDARLLQDGGLPRAAPEERLHAAHLLLDLALEVLELLLELPVLLDELFLLLLELVDLLQDRIVILLQLHIRQGLPLDLVLLGVKLGLEVLPLPADFIKIRSAELTDGLEQVLQVRADVLDSLVRLLQEGSLRRKVPLVGGVGAAVGVGAFRRPLRKKSRIQSADEERSEQRSPHCGARPARATCASRCSGCAEISLE